MLVTSDDLWEVDTSPVSKEAASGALSMVSYKLRFIALRWSEQIMYVRAANCHADTQISSQVRRDEYILQQTGTDDWYLVTLRRDHLLQWVCDFYFHM